MKKVMLIMLLFTVIVSAKTFTKAEKQKMVKQFAEFQTAIKNKDIGKVSSMVQFPLNEDAVYSFSVDENFDEEITEKFFMKNSSSVLEKLDFMVEIKTNPDSGKINGYQNDEIPDEMKKRKYYYDDNEDSYYYKDKNNKKVYETLCSSGVNVYFEDNYLVVSNNSFPSKLTPGASEECDHSVIHYFELIGGKLKLVRVLTAG